MKKLTYNYVKELFDKENYKLLSIEYKNSKTKLLVECPKEHQYEVIYNSFQRGHKCPICYNKFSGDIKRHTYQYVKEQFKKENYKLLSKEYKNAHIKLKVECSKGHQYEVKYAEFQRGRRCPVCYDEIHSDNLRHSYEFVKELFEKENYKLLSKKYKNNSSKLLVECPEGHQYKIRYHNFQQGQRCPICWELETYSQAEKDCLDIVRQIIPDKNVIENDRTQIINPKTGRYLELDIYIPSLNKAIEFNGEYWHKSNYSKFKDNQKIKQCKKRGIDLLIIKYQDWVNNRERQIEKLRISI